MKRIKLFLKRAALVLASCLFALLAAEIAFRKYRPSYDVNIPASYEYDPELAYRLRPGAHLLRTTDFQQESRVNNSGTANFQESFDEYERLVFAVGDSYTQGIGVAADQSYPFQLDLTLNRDAEGFYSKRYGVVNLGVAGFGGEQNLLALRRWAARLRPPSVILYVGCNNDFEDDLMFRGGYRHRQTAPQWWRGSAPVRWLTNETQLGIKVKRLIWTRRRAGLREAAISQMNAGGRTLSVAELERPALDGVAAYARENGALLVVSWSDDGESYEWLKAWAGENGIAFADWVARTKSVTAAVPALPLDNPHTGGHHRGWVNRLIAEEFARHIKANAK